MGSPGIALVITILLLSILFVMAVTFLTLCSRDYIYARYVAMRNQAQYLAESGIEFAQMKRINWDDFPHKESFEMDGGCVDIEVAESGNGVVTIASYGKYGSFRRGIVVTYGPDGTVQKWEER